MSRVMIAEATPGPFLGADLADSSFKQCEVRGQNAHLFSVPKARIAAQPRGSSRSHRCRTPDAIDAAPDAVRRRSLATEQS